VPHFVAPTHRLDFSPLGSNAKKLAAKVIFWREIQILKNKWNYFSHFE
jgi:hypothetical protein